MNNENEQMNNPKPQKHQNHKFKNKYKNNTNRNRVRTQYNNNQNRKYSHSKKKRKGNKLFWLWLNEHLLFCKLWINLSLSISHYIIFINTSFAWCLWQCIQSVHTMQVVGTEVSFSSFIPAHNWITITIHIGNNWLFCCFRQCIITCLITLVFVIWIYFNFCRNMNI